MMTHLDHPDHVYLSSVHCSAVCQEMGERLSFALGRQSSDLPPAFLALIDPLVEGETHDGDRNLTGLKL
jgi:hypothetical protein